MTTVLRLKAAVRAAVVRGTASGRAASARSSNSSPESGQWNSASWKRPVGSAYSRPEVDRRYAQTDDREAVRTGHAKPIKRNDGLHRRLDVARCVLKQHLREQHTPHGCCRAEDSLRSKVGRSSRTRSAGTTQTALTVQDFACARNERFPGHRHHQAT